MTQQIRVISKERFVRSYGMLEDEALRTSVRDAMQVYLDMEN
jgi:hypothetical protein